METKFYELSQNNPGGSHDCDKTVCARMIIEATSIDEAISKAEELGCYWDGVYKGIDCDCCGDRWHQPYDSIDITKYDSIESYAQELADDWGGWTSPDVRIFYKNGEVLEIFKK